MLRSLKNHMVPFVIMILSILFLSGHMFAQENLDAQDITYAIEAELLLDPAVAAHLVDVNSVDGVVTLTGSVDNILAKERATEIAETVKGVRSVVNNILVKPVVREDSAVERDIREALLDNPTTELYDVTIDVNDATVMLDGSVESWQEKQMAARVAKGVKGVRNVENNITIDYSETHSDYDIQQDIESRLLYDTWVDEALINVEVNDGKVTLTGTVGSAYEKRRARTDAWVAGTTEIDASGLEVEWWAHDEMQRQPRETALNDAEIEEAINDAFLYDYRVNPFDLSVEVKQGKAMLSGRVDNLGAKMAAAQDARNTIGVWKVENHIRVRPQKVPSNKALEDRMHNALLRDPYVELSDIDVDARNGLVILDGNVNSSFEKRRAAEIAWDVTGVVDVDNRIDAEHQWVWQSDWQIKEEVKDQLFWSPFVDEDKIQVKVEQGIVTLTGSVESWSAWNQAEENAFKAGAKDVKNKLKVENGLDYEYPYSFLGIE